MADTPIVTQVVVEVLTASAGAHTIQTTQVVFEVLTWHGSAASGGSSATSLTASVVWIYSGVSNQVNIVILKGTAVSSEWVVSGGSNHGYAWTFGNVVNYVGFVSTATTSNITRTFSVAGQELGLRQVSTTLSAQVSALASTMTSAVAVHVGAVMVPNLFGGTVVIENQPKRRVWPI